jgi:hypothetical protein
MEIVESLIICMNNAFISDIKKFKSKKISSNYLADYEENTNDITSRFYVNFISPLTDHYFSSEQFTNFLYQEINAMKNNKTSNVSDERNKNYKLLGERIYIMVIQSQYFSNFRKKFTYNQVKEVINNKEKNNDLCTKANDIIAHYNTIINKIGNEKINDNIYLYNIGCRTYKEITKEYSNYFSNKDLQCLSKKIFTEPSEMKKNMLNFYQKSPDTKNININLIKLFLVNQLK